MYNISLPKLTMRILRIAVDFTRSASVFDPFLKSDHKSSWITCNYETINNSLRPVIY